MSNVGLKEKMGWKSRKKTGNESYESKVGQGGGRRRAELKTKGGSGERYC